MKKFKSTETEDKLLIWLNGAPESWNLYDYERFYEFVYSVIKNDDSISENELALFVIDNKEWKDQEHITDFVDRSIDKINEIKRFFNYLKTKSIIQLL